MKSKLRFSAALVTLAALALALVPDLHPLLGLLTDPHAVGGLLLANAAVGVEMKSVLDAIEAIKTGATEKVGELATKFAEMTARLRELEQKADRHSGGGGGGGQASGALLEALEKSTSLEALRHGHTPAARIVLPADTFQRKTISSSVGGAALINPERSPNIVQLPDRRLTIRDLLPGLPTENGSIEYLRVSENVNNAAVVAEGALKPESTLAFALENAKVVTIAHWTRATKQILDDFPRLLQFINTVLTRGLRLAEETRLLHGSGVGDMSGLHESATPYAAPFTYASPTRLDLARMVIAQLENTEFTPQAWVLNPNDWALIELMKNADGNYLKANPSDANRRVLWGVPVVSTQAMAFGDFLLGDFEQAAVLFDRQQPTLDIATQDGDDFVRNMIKLRVEERMVLALQQPQALIKGEFPN